MEYDGYFLQIIFVIILFKHFSIILKVSLLLNFFFSFE